jgi:transglutaminase-like putative cysteine protease
VQNTSIDTPLVPIEYAGYGDDLTIESPRGGANVLRETLTVRGWSRYARVRAAVEHLETGELRTYTVRADSDGRFVFPIPLEVGFGPCEVKLSSLQVDADTWRGAAVYNVVSAVPSVYMTEPAYQYGTILATGRFRIRGMAPESPTVTVETASEDGAKTYWRADVAVTNGTFEAWVDMPPGAASGTLFQLRVSVPGAGAEDPGSRRAYTVAFTPRRPDPKPTESWVAHSSDQAIRELAASIGGDRTDHYEIVLAIHDWVARNIAYDVRGAKTLKPGPVDALSTLARRESVCMGYANLMAALLRAAGLRAWVLIGNADNGITVVKHAWNEVEVNGRIVAIDATWDSGGVEGWSFVRRYSRAFFDPRPDQLAFTHFEDR